MRFVIVVVFLFQFSTICSAQNVHKTTRILAQSDLDQLSIGMTWNMVWSLFGESLSSASEPELEVQVWPRGRGGSADDDKVPGLVWANGYWFIFEKNPHDFGKSTLLFVVSHAHKVDALDDSYTMADMTINWPVAHVGKSIEEASTAKNGKGVSVFPVISYDTKTSSAKSNTIIRTAAGDGENWVADALLVVKKIKGIADSKEAGYISIEVENPSGEVRNTTKITVIEDGYLDDSVRGEWKQFLLEYDSREGYWQVMEIRTAVTCWRGFTLQVFSEAECL